MPLSLDSGQGETSNADMRGGVPNGDFQVLELPQKWLDSLRWTNHLRTSVDGPMNSFTLAWQDLGEKDVVVFSVVIFCQLEKSLSTWKEAEISSIREILARAADTGHSD